MTTPRTLETHGEARGPRSLVELLSARALTQADRLAYTFLRDGEAEEVSLTYAALDARARAVAAALQAAGAGGERVLLLFPPGLEYVAAFFGCLYAGAVAVPVYPPRLNHLKARLKSIVTDARAAFALTTRRESARVGPVLGDELGRLRWLVSEDIPDATAESWRPPEVGGETLAFLQYTSGSTSTPKGVMVSHANLLHNEAMIQRAFGQTEDSVIVGWLPLYHDMGLIGNVVQPLYTGARCVLMSPLAFLQKPLRWLEAISRYRATTSGGPNFAYDLCARKVSAAQLPALDLSCWQVAFNGSEPVRAETLERFAAAFAPCGFRPEAFAPCYGLAEATLLVSGGPKRRPPFAINVSAGELEKNRVVEAEARGSETRVLVGCGESFAEQQTVAIVDTETLTPCEPGRVGEIWLAGPSVAGGYWNRPEETEASFGAALAGGAGGPFLRTGDLGFFKEGHLFVTGRLKDLIIIRGRNHYPHDIELTAEQGGDCLRRGAAAAFAVEVGGEERLVLVVEADHHRRADFDEAIQNVRRVVAEEHDIQVHAVALIKPGSIPKTSSGKIQRRACRAAFQNGGLSVMREWREEAAGAEPVRESSGDSAPPHTAAEIELWLRRQLAASLGIDPAGVNPDLPITQYGVDSLASVELTHGLESALGISLSLTDFLRGPTLSELAARAATLVSEGRAAHVGLPPAEQYDTSEFPLSRGQEALWFLHQMSPESAAYNIASAARVRSRLDVGALRRAAQALVERHPALRTTFHTKDERHFQRVHDGAEVCFAVENSPDWDEALLRRRLVEASQRPFDLRTEMPLRLSLYTRGDGEHVLLLTAHHIAADLWSLGVLVQELGEIYTAEVRGERAQLPPPPRGYEGFVRWQALLLAGEEGERQGSFWERQLAGAPVALNLPTDRQRPPLQTFNGASAQFTLDAALTQRLHELARSNDATLYTTLLAAFQLLLHKYSGQRDIVVGSPAAARGRPEFAGTVGYFVNTLALRAEVSDSLTFESLLAQARGRVLEAFEHQDYPFPLVVERVQPQRDPSRSPLFQAMFVLQRSHLPQLRGLGAFALGEEGARVSLGELTVESLSLEQRDAQFDLKLSAAEIEGGLAASFEYNTDLFDAATVARMAEHFRQLLENVAARPRAALSAVSCLPEAERRKLLRDYNDTARDYDLEVCLHGLIESQAARTPERFALSYEGRRLTYREMNERANRLAHLLRALGVGPESLVGVLLPRSAETVVALLAILKAGGAYVPLDPSYPADRLRFMLEDSAVSLLLTEEGLGADFAASTRVINLDERREELGRQPSANPDGGVLPDNAAYMIYTSGSTGTPKGALNTHRAICNRLLWMQEAYGLGTDDRVLQKTPYSFDVSVWELFWPLLTGAELVVARPGGHQDSAYLVELIAGERITTLHFVPSMLRAWLEEPDVERCGESLRRVICSGEALGADLQQQFFERLNVGLHNLYGPTEAAVDVTYWECVPDADARTVPIGRPIANTSIYLLDAHLRPVPAGVAGELYIGGGGVARGYHGRPALTAGRFIPDPFSDVPGRRLYRTGDLARHLAEGQIEFLGRADDQVKVRGFRVELGEIEAALAQHPSVGEVVVVARDDGGSGKRLVAYVTGAARAEELRVYLRESLPDYMVPSQFVTLDALPLSPNGKIDRKALPAPEAAGASGAEFAPPRTPTEELLCNLFAEVLRAERVGREDNFFELGGDSIRSLQVVARAKRSGLRLSLQDIFRAQTVRELAAHLESSAAEEQEAEPTEPFSLVNEGDRRRLPAGAVDAYPLSMLQAGMLFHSDLDDAASVYHDIFSFHLRAQFDAHAFEAAARRLVARHPALRTSFALAGFSEPLQIVRGSCEPRLRVEDLRGLDARAQDEAVSGWVEDEKRRGFDWSDAPLLRLQVHRRGEETFQFTVSFHHAILDGWSVATMLSELFGDYFSLLQDEHAPEPAAPAVALRDFVAAERRSLSSAEHEEFWRGRLCDLEVARLARGSRARGGAQTGEVRRLDVPLDAGVSDGLKELARLASVPVKSVLLAAHLRVLSLLVGREEVVTGLVSNGRAEESGGESALGLFLNTLPFRQRLAPGSWVDLARATFANERELLPHRRYPMAQMRALCGGQTLFETSFNFVHFHVYESLFRLGGLEVLGSSIFEATNFPLSAQFSLDPVTSRVEFDLRYDTAALSAGEVEAFGALYARALSAMAAEPHARQELWSALGEDERRRLLVEWNDTKADFPRDVCVHELFERQAARTPDAVAVEFEGRRLTYDELNRGANRLANLLRGMGVGPEATVALLLERSAEMIVALLGVLKAGGAYVPLDTNAPEARLRQGLADSGARVLVTRRALAGSLAGGDAEVVCLDAHGSSLSLMSDENVRSGATADNLAYVIYTSGSTGTPKGVCCNHRGVVNLFDDAQRRQPLAPGDACSFWTIPSFDVSVYEIFACLLAGGALHVVPEQVRPDAGTFVEWLGRHGIRAGYVPNFVLPELLEQAAGGRGLSLRRVLVGVEPIEERLLSDLRDAIPGLHLFNAYGPTEATVYVTAYRVPAQGALRRRTPIGKPIQNTRVYVLDANSGPVPVGVAGELHVGGVGVARGYLNRPFLTAQRFIPDPFSTEPGARLYKTGDLVRYLPDGQIEFIGRADNQVKVRGFRIELGEIEAALSRHPSVREAAAVVKENGDGDKRIIAYVAGEAVQANELREHLRESLPDYMVPSAFVALDALPLTRNGKVDRQSLLSIQPPREDVEVYAAPSDEVEEILAGMWAEVLGLGRVGGGSDFFALGGHSLLATQLISRVRQAFGVEVAMRTLFEQPTVAAFAARLREALRAGRADEVPPLEPSAREELMPLSFAQQRLWFMSRLGDGGAGYNVTSSVRLTGSLNVEALERGLSEVLRRHEVLRARFVEVDGQPLQTIAEASPVSVPVQDLTPLPEDERRAACEPVAQAEADRPFDLAAGPMLRARLLRLSDDEHVLLLTMHHIASDGWSVGVLVRELSALYAAYSLGQESPLPDLPIQYADYSAWQRRVLSGEALEKRLGYWRERLRGIEPLELPTERPRTSARGLRGASLPVALPDALSERLRELSRREGATLFMTLLAAWQTLLSRYAGQDDIAVGTPVAGRTRRETEGLIGFFVNMLVLRTDLSGGPTFRELLARVRETCLGAYAHQEVPFERVVEELSPGRDLTRSPLFQVVFALQNAPGETPTLPDLRMDSFETRSAAAQYDLALLMSSEGGALGGRLEYDPDLFDGPTVERIVEHFLRLLENVAADPDAEVGAYELLGERELRQLLVEWNATATGPESARPVHRLFESWAEETPEAPAVSCQDGRLSYRELNERANRLAHMLRGVGVGPESLVGVLLGRSAALVTALLAVLKAGGAYLPLDPSYPEERLRYMLEDSGVSLLLTEEQYAEAVARSPARVLCLDAQGHALSSQVCSNLPAEVDPFNLAYVIYTSGSTGTPKGVELQHGGLNNLVGWHRRVYDIAPEDRATLVASPAFDASVWELWPYLAAGASVHIPAEDDVAFPPSLLRWMAESGITAAFLPTPLAEAILDEALPEGLSLRLLLTGGDRLNRRPSQRLPFKFINHYGPTENTVVATCAPVAPDDNTNAPPPIGRPIANAQTYVLDARFRPVPVGVNGELYVGGEGAARGYHKRPRLTAERFVPDPFSSEPGRRLYKTGDVARYLPDGQIEFIGRADNQVKVRGFRIELGEVEAALSRHPSVREAAVLAREDGAGDRRLVAYVTGAATAEELRVYLRESLPDYMVPSQFVMLDALPLSPNGKIDRKALPAPEASGAPMGEVLAPRTPTEELLCNLFAEVLRAGVVGREQNFFELGGHSLLATQLVSRVRSAFGVELPLRSLFERPTPAALAAEVERTVREAGGAALLPAIEPVAREDGDLPLSFAQQRLWFIDQLEPGAAAYNIPAAVRLRGALDAEALARSLSEVVRRHEALRTSFAAEGGRPVQRVAPPEGFDMPLLDLGGLAEDERDEEVTRRAAEEAERPFDLAAGPMLRAQLLRLSDEEHVLLLTMHHIASDGWSVGVLVKELSALYAAFSRGAESPLAELPIQYADYSVWQRRVLDGDVLDAQLSYWRGRLQGVEPLALTTDRPRAGAPGGRGAAVQLSLGSGLAGHLRELSRQEGVTLFMTLLAAFQTLLSRYTGQEDVSVGTPVAGRTRPETENLIGFFVNMLALRTDLSGDPTFRELLARVREVCLGAYAHQEVPFERVVEEAATVRDLARSPLFQVQFVLQNAPAAEMALPGLTVETVAGAGRAAKYDLTLAAVEGPDGELGLTLEYDAGLFKEATAGRMLSHYARLLEGAAAEPGARASELEMLTPEERRRILVEWNQTGAEFEQGSCIHELFERQAALTPESVAVECADERLTYIELNRRTDVLAERLRAAGVGPESPVGVCVGRGVWAAAALLGVMKAGGAYVPLDPAYPAERMRLMIEDTRMRVLVSERRLAESSEVAAELLSGSGGVSVETVIFLEDLSGQGGGSKRKVGTNARTRPDADNLAYVIYTSGSTGRPKGVAITHRSATTLIHWAQTVFAPEHLKGVLASTSFCFDLSVFEMFVPLSCGGAVIMAENALQLPTLPARERVTLVNTVPSAMTEIVRADALPGSVRVVNLAGEPLRNALVQGVYRSENVGQVFNLYGPSEDTTYSTFVLAEKGADGEPTIGRPVANTQTYILDRHMRPVPQGVVGELFIGGDGLARGYLYRPALTAERFIPDPFSSEPGRRLYKTGDLARYLPDGQIEFLGRRDHQVKIRGFRIELGEIEARLTQHPDVREAVVLVREDTPGDRRLVAYVAGAATADELRTHLRESLPEYMVPPQFVALDALPLTPNGKVNRKALPAPEPRQVSAAEFVAPQTPAEAQVAAICAEVLGGARVGREDNFFELGGHSLLATQFVSRVREAFGVDIPLRALFEQPTVAGFAAAVEQRQLEQMSDERLALMLNELDGVSDEEAAAMLAVEGAGGEDY